MDEGTRLALPEQTAAPPGDFDPRPRAVEDWLQNLPVADLAQTSRTVYARLRQTNRIDLAPAARLGFVDQLVAMAGYIVAGLRKHYVGRELPLRHKPRKVASLATLLLEEMALGYEIVLENGRDTRLRRSALAAALVGAIGYHGRVLLENWLVYEPPPTGAWQRLHALYRIGEQLGVLDRAVRRPAENDHRPRLAPVTVYKHIALTAAAGPTRMGSGEVLDVWSLLGRWATAARITDLAEVDEAVFRIPRASDDGPHPSAPELDRPDDRALVTGPLVREFERELARGSGVLSLRRRSALANIQPALCRRLMLALAALPEPRPPRVRAQARVHAILGLTGIHRRLALNAGMAAPADDHRRTFVATDSARPPNEPSDVWNVIYPSELMRELHDRDREAAALGQPREAPELDDWSLVNISAGGYCLLSDPCVSRRVQIGELVLLREVAGRDLPWQLGCVRWMSAARDRGLRVGLQILGYSPKPVLLSAEQPDCAFGPRERGFLVPRLDTTDQPATVITAEPHFAVGRRARMYYAEESVDLRLHALRDSTLHFQQFDVQHDAAPAGNETLAALFAADDATI